MRLGDLTEWSVHWGHSLMHPYQSQRADVNQVTQVLVQEKACFLFVQNIVVVLVSIWRQFSHFPYSTDSKAMWCDWIQVWTIDRNSPNQENFLVHECFEEWASIWGSILFLGRHECLQSLITYPKYLMLVIANEHLSMFKYSRCH